MGTVSCWIVPSKVNRARVNVHVARTNVVGDNTAMLSITFVQTCLLHVLRDMLVMTVIYVITVTRW